MRRPSRVRRGAVGIAAATALLALGLGVSAALGATDSDTSAPLPTASSTVFPRNAAGQTYGSELDAATPADAPDLIEAIATNGKLGYVKNTDLHPAGPTSPADAIAQQAAQQARQIPVFASDGKTQIGVFDIAAGSGASTG